MKTKQILTILLGGTIFMACQFNQSAKKDLATGAVSRGDGLGCDEFTLQINGEAENRNHFTYGEKAEFIFNNIKGLRKENGKAFPGLSLFIVKNEKDTVQNLSNPDLFADMTNGTDLSPLQLRAHFSAILPYQNEEQYKVYIKIWDKKGDGTYTYEMPFSISTNELLNVTESSGIGYSDILLWNKTEGRSVTNGRLSIKQSYSFVLKGINGLTVIEEKAFPALSMEITDARGNEIISSQNVLEAYSESGVDYTILQEELPISITFTEGEIHNPCKFKARFYDLKSDKSINVDAELIIE